MPLKVNPPIGFSINGRLARIGPPVVWPAGSLIRL